MSDFRLRQLMFGADWIARAREAYEANRRAQEEAFRRLMASGGCAC